MRRIPCFSLLAAVAALAVTSAPADAAKAPIVTKVYLAYQNNGKVPPCTFTASQLKDALKNVTPDIKQYAPDFEDAIKVALEQRATGVCDKSAKKKSNSSGAVVAPSAGSGGATPAAPATTAAPVTSTPKAPAQTTAAPVTSTPQPDPAVNPAPPVADNAIPAAATSPAASGTGDAPAPLLVLAVLLGTLLVLAALWSAVRWMGYDPPWLRRWRHASQEAGWRASAAWSEFTDWVRLGR